VKNYFLVLMFFLSTGLVNSQVLSQVVISNNYIGADNPGVVQAADRSFL
jgi:hypothetical protein